MAKKLNEIRLEIKDKDGNINTYIKDSIPMKKMIEWYKIEEAIDNGELKEGIEVINKKIEFVASVFDDERVTPEAILEGVDSRLFQESIQGIIYQVLGFDLSELSEKEGK